MRRITSAQRSEKRQNALYCGLICICTTIFLFVLTVFVLTMSSDARPGGMDGNGSGAWDPMDFYTMDNDSSHNGPPSTKAGGEYMQKVPAVCIDAHLHKNGNNGDSPPEGTDGPPDGTNHGPPAGRNDVPPSRRRNMLETFQGVHYHVQEVDVWVGNMTILYNSSVIISCDTGTVLFIGNLEAAEEFEAMITRSATNDTAGFARETKCGRKTSVERIQGRGRILTPGLIDAGSRAGLVQWPLDLSDAEIYENTHGSLSSCTSVMDAFDIFDPAVAHVLHDSGVTTAQVLGSGHDDAIGPRGAVVKYRFDNSDAEGSTQFVQKQSRVISMSCVADNATRLQSLAQLHTAFKKARQYSQKVLRWCAQLPADVYAPLGLGPQFRAYVEYDAAKHGTVDDATADAGSNCVDALGDLFYPFVTDAIVVNVECHRATDLMAFLDMFVGSLEDDVQQAKAIRLLVHGAAEAYIVQKHLEAIAPKFGGVFLAFDVDLTRPTMDTYYASIHDMASFVSSSIGVLVRTNHPRVYGGSLVHQVAKAWHYNRHANASEQALFQSVTTTAAQALGLAALGRVDVGAQADIVLWNTHPYDNAAAEPETIFIEGTQVVTTEDTSPVQPKSIFDAGAAVFVTDGQGLVEERKSLQNLIENIRRAQQADGHGNIWPVHVSPALLRRPELDWDKLLLQNIGLSRNEYFRMVNPVYRVRIRHDDGHATDAVMAGRFCDAEYGERDALRSLGQNHSIIILNVDVMDLQTDKSYARDCNVGIVNGMLECIECTISDGKYPPGACVFGVDRAYNSHVTIDFMVEGPDGIFKPSAFRPILVPTLISGEGGAHVGQIDIGEESTAQNGISRGISDAKTGLRFRSKQMNEVWASGAGIAISTPQSMNVVTGRTVAFTTHSRNINNALVGTPDGGMLHVQIGRHLGIAISEQFAIIDNYLTQAARSRASVDQMWADLLDRKIAMAATVHQSDQITNLINLKTKYGFDLTIIGASEMNLVADEIQVSGTKVVLAPLRCLPDRWERRRCDWRENVRYLVEKNITFAIAGTTLDEVKHVRWEAARLLGFVSYQQALASVTTNVARVFKLPSAYYGLALHKQAGFVVFDNDPLSITSRVLVHVNGHYVGCNPRIG